MQFKKSIFSVIAVLLLLGMALLPAIFTGTSRAGLVGPDLSSFKYVEVEFYNGDLKLAGMIFVPEASILNL